MDIFRLTSLVNSEVLNVKSDDDFSDRLNYRYTVAILIFFSLILTTRQSLGSEVIRCWVPAHFKPSYEQYVQQICWVQNTYYVQPHESIPQFEHDREKEEIQYYQWVSFILLIQAFFFYCPRVFWTTFSAKCGLFIGDLTQAADKYKSCDKFDKKEDYMDYIVKNIDQLVDDQRRHDRKKTQPFSKITQFVVKTCPCIGRFEGNYVVVLYLVTKLIYILNAIAQVTLVGGLLGKSFWFFGFEFVRNLINGHGWTVANSKYFPKVTLCDFKIREIGNPNKSHRYTVQCVLPINLFNQQIFTVIWFWYIILLAWNIYTLISWVKKLFPVNAKNFIKKRTNLFNENVRLKLVPRRFDHFVRKYLEADGIFIIRIIGENTSDYVATDLIHQLWCQHHEKYGSLFPNEPHQRSHTCTFKHCLERLKEHSQNSIPMTPINPSCAETDYSTIRHIIMQNLNNHNEIDPFKILNSKIDERTGLRRELNRNILSNESKRTDSEAEPFSP